MYKYQIYLHIKKNIYIYITHIWNTWCLIQMYPRTPPDETGKAMKCCKAQCVRYFCQDPLRVKEMEELGLITVIILIFLIGVFPNSA